MVLRLERIVTIKHAEVLELVALLEKASKGPMVCGHDGPSRPIITGANFSMFRISKLEYDRWGSYDNEEEDCELFAKVVNVGPDLVKTLLAAIKILEFRSSTHARTCGCDACLLLKGYYRTGM